MSAGFQSCLASIQPCFSRSPRMLQGFSQIMPGRDTPGSQRFEEGNMPRKGDDPQQLFIVRLAGVALVEKAA